MPKLGVNLISNAWCSTVRQLAWRGSGNVAKTTIQFRRRVLPIDRESADSTEAPIRRTTRFGYNWQCLIACSDSGRLMTCGCDPSGRINHL